MSDHNSDTVVMTAVGDVLVDRPNPLEVVEPIAPLLQGSDFAFGNFEGVLTDAHRPTPGCAHATVVPSANGVALTVFDVMSLANNHVMDAGYGGLEDTITALSGRDVRAVGAGASLEDALAPVTLEQRGVRVAFVAVTSAFRWGAEAGPALPGVAPLRAEDFYGPRVPGLYNPGLAPRVVSILDEGDWSRLTRVIGSVRDDADLVAVSVHWGDYSRPWVLTDHERTCGPRLIEAGADIVLGHHQHVMRGVQVIEGRPIFYGLGHIAFDHPQYLAEMKKTRGIEMDRMSQEQLAARFGEFGIYPRPGSPNFPFHDLARHTGVAVLEVTRTGVRRIGMAPCWIDNDGVARPVRRNTPEWAGALTFLRRCMESTAQETEVADHGWCHDGYDLVEFVDERSAAE